MDELSIEDRKYLFKKFKEIKIPFQDKTGCFFEFKEKMRKFHLKLFDKKAEYWFPEVQNIKNLHWWSCNKYVYKSGLLFQERKTY